MRTILGKLAAAAVMVALLVAAIWVYSIGAASTVL